ncbi:DUF4209 domain-containing protein [Quadrisphaera sp. INWT6]|uniref:DUF4209 domain-containing protein n=1 Tax=Quadrisphaera sp. INWT6 TaxID=2596917 RepID=UPI0018921FDD|nr:DUF4209 domain-containing protein [Quadrisphaera sp. INWT6]MBF5082337.1 DUF4209 domain-containing protein [Quadrisphaera sp. INWT6]
MSDDPASSAPNGVDPAWWLTAYTDAEAGLAEAPDLIAGKLFALARDAPEGTLQRRVLEVLARASSPQLEPEDWEEPFVAMRVTSRGRTAVPDDLEADERTLLGQLVPLITPSPLRARAADIAWTYGDRRRRDLLMVAIEAYLDLPLDRHTWVRLAHDSYKRALELARRSGAAGRPQLREATDRLQEVITTEASESVLVADCSELLRAFGRLGAEQAHLVAEQIQARAAATLAANTHLSRRLEEEARSWYGKCGQPELALGCTARVAQTFVREAEARQASDFSASMSAGRSYERAIAALRQLPTRYRQEHGLEERIRELRARADESRRALLDSMVAIETEPFDLTDSARTARAAVSEKTPSEALRQFCRLRPPFDFEEFMGSAREQALGGLSRLFSQETYTASGQRVAARGGLAGETDEDYTWAQAVKNFEYRVAMIVSGVILPAQEALTFEHRYPFPTLLHLCERSPSVPLGHEAMWARGIWHGLRQDYPSAAALLVPQIEQLIRTHLKSHGVHTLMVDDRSGVETEKSLGALLDVPDLETTLGEVFVFELKALLVSKEGANLRNAMAHGLLNDEGAVSSNTVYIWWLTLFFAFAPFFSEGPGTSDVGDA